MLAQVFQFKFIILYCIHLKWKTLLHQIFSGFISKGF